MSDHPRRIRTPWTWGLVQPRSSSIKPAGCFVWSDAELEPAGMAAARATIERQRRFGFMVFGEWRSETLTSSTHGGAKSSSDAKIARFHLTRRRKRTFSESEAREKVRSLFGLNL